MLIIPAIDMKDHQVVRLRQGRMQDATVYREDIVEQARLFAEQGATRLHLVDLNGAFAGKPVHFDVIAQIAKNFPQLKIEVGGGIRDLKTIRHYLDAGVAFCILGTVAIKDPEVVQEAAQHYPGKIILGVDAKDGLVATEGWDEDSATSALDLIQEFSGCTFESVIYTDITRDGMLEGMNFPAIQEMKERCGFPVIASGGLSSLEDIATLRAMGVHGVIAGKAIYEGHFTLSQAMKSV